jgi:hypothetical protein
MSAVDRYVVVTSWIKETETDGLVDAVLRRKENE